MSGSHNYDTFRIGSGATLYVNGNELEIEADNIIVNGEINAKASGYLGGYRGGTGNGPGGGPGYYDSGANAGGGGYGAGGGCGPVSGAYGCGAGGGNSYGSRTSRSVNPGSGGGEGYPYYGCCRGGNGGGAVSLIGNNIQVSGTINVKGENGPASSWYAYGDGGGSGGGVLIDGVNVDLSGAQFYAKGGDAGNPYGGSGAGGRIKIFYGSLDSGYSTNVNGPNSHTYGGSLYEYGAIGGDGTVYTEQVANPDAPVIQEMTLDESAGDPATIDGTVDVNVDEDGGRTPDNQLTSCGVTATGEDSGGSIDLPTQVGSSSCEFSVDNDDHGSWNADETISLEVTVEDSYGGTDQLTQFEQFPVNPPNAPDNPEPSDAEQTVGTGHELSVRATHPDGLDNMDVRFYLRDQNGAYSQIGPIKTADDEGRVFVNPNLDPGTQYTWRASASKQGKVTDSSEWTFTTNYRPSVDSIQVNRADSGHSVSLTAVVSDRDGEDQIDSCSVDVQGESGNEFSPSAQLEGGGGPNEKICSVDEVNFVDGSWSHLEQLEFEVTVTDDKGLSESGNVESSLPNHDPVIESFNTVEYPDSNAFRVESVIKAVDGAGNELRDCSIVVESSDNSVSGGSLRQINSSYYRCIENNIGRSSGISSESQLEINLEVSDIHGATSDLVSPYNIDPGLKYRYTAVALYPGSKRYVNYVLKNEVGSDSSYRLYLEGLNATFRSNGEDKLDLTLGEGESVIKRMVVNPVEGTDASELRVVVHNKDTGINRTESLDAKILSNKGGSSDLSVPGIGLLQLLVLFMASIAYFVFRNW